MNILLTDREADIMQVLWERGPSVVAEVRGRLSDELAYTTVLTILRTLEAKGYVRHEEEGRVHRYAAAVQRQAARKSALRHLTRKLFDGSADCCWPTWSPTGSSLPRSCRDCARSSTPSRTARTMMFAWMLYVVVVTLVVGAAALSAEKAARLRRAPSRWIWIAAMAASLVIPACASHYRFSRRPGEPGGRLQRRRPAAACPRHQLAG